MRFFNTAIGHKEDFNPESKKLGLYICGPTVYSDTHLGHAKSYVSFDVLKRWLGYKGYEVNHIQNFTDVSDETKREALHAQVLAETLLSEERIEETGGLKRAKPN